MSNGLHVRFGSTWCTLKRRSLPATVTKATCLMRMFGIGWIWRTWRFRYAVRGGGGGLERMVWSHQSTVSFIVNQTHMYDYVIFGNLFFLTSTSLTNVYWKECVTFFSLWVARTLSLTMALTLYLLIAVTEDFQFRQNVLHGAPSLIQQVIGGPTKGKKFPGALCHNHASAGYPTPIKGDWTKGCDPSWSEEETQKRCFSYQETACGIEIMKKLEIIHAKMDPDHLWLLGPCWIWRWRW